MVGVTGASGLVGRHLVEKLVAEGVAVAAIVRNPKEVFSPSVVVRTADVMDPLGMRQSLEGITTVIHAAANVSFNPRRRKEIAEINVAGTRHVVNACLQSGIKNLVHVSSVAALGRKAGEPITEDHVWTGLHVSDYAHSKYLAELEVFRGAEEGLNVSLVNPSVVLSGAHPNRSSASLLSYVWRGGRFYTHGMLNYVDARDVADAVYHLVQHPMPGQKYILSGGSITYKEFFDRLARHWGKRAPSIRISSGTVSVLGFAEELLSALLNREPRVTRQSAAMTVRSFSYDTSKAHRLLGKFFRPIEDTLAWCCENYAQNVNRNK